MIDVTLEPREAGYSSRKADLALYLGSKLKVEQEEGLKGCSNKCIFSTLYWIKIQSQ